MGYINIKELREKGYLQEVNRRFFHPLGLALEITIDENKNEIISGILDCRKDKEGLYWGINNFSEKRKQNFTKNKKFIDDEIKKREDVRKKRFNDIIEPISITKQQHGDKMTKYEARIKEQEEVGNITAVLRQPSKYNLISLRNIKHSSEKVIKKLKQILKFKYVVVDICPHPDTIENKISYNINISQDYKTGTCIIKFSSTHIPINDPRTKGYIQDVIKEYNELIEYCEKHISYWESEDE